MDSVENIINTLRQIQQASIHERMKLIFTFQKDFLNDKSIIDENLETILSDLAIDLDFYEPNQEVRNGEMNLYDEDRLLDLLEDAILQLKKYAKTNQP